MVVKPLKDKFIQISVIISIISVLITIAINIRIANKYLLLDGKSKALFGLKELSQFSYQYYVCIFGVIAIIFALKAKNTKISKIITLLLAISTIALVFVRFWMLLV